MVRVVADPLAFIAVLARSLTAQIDAWAVGRFGPIAGMQNRDDSFILWLLYHTYRYLSLRIGEFVLAP